MSIGLIKAAMQPYITVQALKMNLDAWGSDVDMRGRKVSLFRDYVDGVHRNYLTARMQARLRVKGGDQTTLFTDNYMDIVVQTMVDRLIVSQIRAAGGNAAGQAWIDEVLRGNRFDQTQVDVHEAAVRDGDTFVLVGWDNAAGKIVLSHEPAFDGVSGMVVIHGERGVDLAIKTWQLGGGETIRVNVYTPGEIRKYVAVDGTNLQPYRVEGEAWPAPWVLPGGEAIGVPVIHFRNRGKRHDRWGYSEIENAIPLQDMLNRTLYSMVATSENTAFQTFVAQNFQPPDKVTPGMWIVILDSEGMPLDKDVDAKAYTLEAGEIVPFLEQAKFLAGEIGRVTRTPAPELVWSDASGESLKQREVGLLGKVQRFQVSAGNAWEDVAALAVRVQRAYGKMPPVVEGWDTQWASAEIRDDKTLIENVMKVRELIGEQAAIEAIAPAFGWDASRIAEIISQKAAEDEARLALMVSQMPTFQRKN